MQKKINTDYHFYDEQYLWSAILICTNLWFNEHV